MCGISCILFYPKKRSRKEWDEIRKTFVSCHIFNETKGMDASGIALIEDSGEHYLYKEPVRISELHKRKRYRDILDMLDERTVCLLGHTRAMTKGDPSNNLNNHPIIAGRVIGIHNGHINNDDALFSEFFLERSGEVDSEVIFRLFDKLSSMNSVNSYLHEIMFYIKHLKGSYTTLSVDLRNPHILTVMRHFPPISYHYYRKWEALIFSTRYAFLRKTFGTSVIHEIIYNSRVMIFDAYKIRNLEGKPEAWDVIV